MRVTNQGGSLAGFIIIGVLLTLVLVGGLYGLNRYNTQRAAEEVAVNEDATEKSPESTDSKETVPNDAEPTGRERTDTSGSTSAPAPVTAPSTPPATGGSGAATQAQLPQTGPADMLGALAVLGVLTFAGTHYVRSRG